MGYIRPSGFPRVVSGDNYFYPRQQFRPEFLTKPKKTSHSLKNHKLDRAINPFYAQNYYYPAPYLQVPNNGKPLKFKSNKFYYPIVYAPYNLVPVTEKVVVKNDTGRLGKIVVLSESERSPKLIGGSTKAPAADSARKNQISYKKNKPVENQREEEEEEENSESLIEDIVRIIVPEAAVIADEIEEEERQEKSTSTTKFPPLKNDKYLNLDLQDEKDDNDEYDGEARNLAVDLANNSTRALSFQNSIERIQNLTKVFSFNRGDAPEKKSDELPSASSSTEQPIDVMKEEQSEEAVDDQEELKSPFAFAFGPKQQLQTFKEGGLIIQRLRVRHGGIAIAGPGGVATAGSGGTAIVGPNGIAFTHPRGLAIGGPGARIYAVPESTDLEDLALTHKARKLDNVGVLVARGPAIFYNKEI